MCKVLFQITNKQRIVFLIRLFIFIFLLLLIFVLSLDSSSYTLMTDSSEYHKAWLEAKSLNVPESKLSKEEFIELIKSLKREEYRNTLRELLKKETRADSSYRISFYLIAYLLAGLLFSEDQDVADIGDDM